MSPSAPGRPASESPLAWSLRTDKSQRVPAMVDTCKSGLLPPVQPSIFVPHVLPSLLPSVSQWSSPSSVAA
eukprot:8755351-Lingulodinium_polyedra.AAC.1